MATSTISTTSTMQREGRKPDSGHCSIGMKARLDGERDSRIPLGNSNYFSRRSCSGKISTRDLPLEEGALGSFSLWGIINICIMATVPIAYIYILLILVRELCMSFPNTIYDFIRRYMPVLAKIVSTMEKSSWWVESWCIIEACFFVLQKLHIQWLQMKDPLEASLASAPMMELKERRILWHRMMATEQKDPITFLTGWFFDASVETISRYDVRDFCAWSMFEGRNLEHLTEEETSQVDSFLDEAEWRLGVHLYGLSSPSAPSAPSPSTRSDFPPGKNYENGNHRKGGPNVPGFVGEEREPESESESEPEKLPGELLLAKDERDGPLSAKALEKIEQLSLRAKRPKPNKEFRFSESTPDDATSNFFTNLYENYKERYEQYKKMMMDTAPDFHPVKDFYNFMVEAEENAMSTAAVMYENAYNTLVSPGSTMDKQLTAIGHATQVQWTEAWNSVKGMKERLEMAEFLSGQRKRIRQRLRGYRELLNRMRAMSATSPVPSKHMARLLRKITDCYEGMERVERSAMEAFGKATGYARKQLPPLPQSITAFRMRMNRETPPQRFAKYSFDPLLGVAMYPLGFHLFVLAATEIPLRMWLQSKGFTRHSVGPINYYFHPGRSSEEDIGDDLEDDDFQDGEAAKSDPEKLPVVFVHGIGLGLIMYLPFLDHLLRLGRPILLPEIPYVSGLRPWQSPNAVLPPHVVVSTLSDILASHGFLRGAFVGHSYGTSWLSYMIKYAPHAIAAVVFLDPICFCLHAPRLTKQFVYVRPDPGAISYMVRTDVMVNWTIQRSFPWAWIVLFVEQIHIPCSVFLSECDMLVPAVKVESYLKSKNAPIRDFGNANSRHFVETDVNVTVFRGDCHGGWTERPAATSPKIAECVEILCTKAETSKRS